VSDERKPLPGLPHGDEGLLTDSSRFRRSYIHGHAKQDVRRSKMDKWEYAVAPLEEGGKLKKRSDAISPEKLNELGQQGWEAVGVTLKRGDLVAWPIVLLKRRCS